MIRNWVSACLETHSECHQEPAPLPTNVLDLSRGAPFLTDGKGVKAPYIILSHCWGTTATLRTTQATEAAHRQGIDEALLPATFRDVVNIARALKIRYLWIDSLCILQDSQEK